MDARYARDRIVRDREEQVGASSAGRSACPPLETDLDVGDPAFRHDDGRGVPTRRVGTGGCDARLGTCTGRAEESHVDAVCAERVPTAVLVDGGERPRDLQAAPCASVEWDARGESRLDTLLGACGNRRDECGRDGEKSEHETCHLVRA